MGAVTPGLVCGHHHLYSALARGMPAPPRAADRLPAILEQIWWRLDAALDLEMLRVVGACSARSRRCSAARPRSSTTTRARTRSRAASTSSPTRAPRSACGWSCAYGVTDRHGADGARRGLAENERFLRAGGRGMVGVHAAFTCTDDTLEAAAGLAARSRRRRAHPRGRGPATTSTAGARLEPLAADDWLLVHCVHLDRDLPGTIAHNPRSNMNNAVGYAAPARRPNRGRARHRRHRRRHARGVPPRLRRPPRRRRARLARHGVELARGGLPVRPRGARRPGDVELRPRRLAVARRLHARASGRSTWSAATARCWSRDGLPHGSTSTRSRAKAAEQAARLFSRL